MNGISHIHEEEDTRPSWLRFLVSVWLATAIVIALLGAILLVVAAGGAGNSPGHWNPARGRRGGRTRHPRNRLRGPLPAQLLTLVLSMGRPAPCAQVTSPPHLS